MCVIACAAKVALGLMSDVVGADVVVCLVVGEWLLLYL